MRDRFFLIQKRIRHTPICHRMVSKHGHDDHLKCHTFRSCTKIGQFLLEFLQKIIQKNPRVCIQRTRKNHVVTEVLLLILQIGWNYHNSGLEKVRTANSKIFLAGFRGPGPKDCSYLM